MGDNAYFLSTGICKFGSVIDVYVTRYCPNVQRANTCHYVSYIMLLQKTIVYKTPPGVGGGGRGSIASSMSIGLNHRGNRGRDNLDPGKHV